MIFNDDSHAVWEQSVLEVVSTGTYTFSWLRADPYDA